MLERTWKVFWAVPGDDPSAAWSSKTSLRQPKPKPRDSAHLRPCTQHTRPSGKGSFIACLFPSPVPSVLCSHGHGTLRTSPEPAGACFDRRGLMSAAATLPERGQGSVPGGIGAVFFVSVFSLDGPAWFWATEQHIYIVRRLCRAVASTAKVRVNCAYGVCRHGDKYSRAFSASRGLLSNCLHLRDHYTTLG